MFNVIRIHFIELLSLGFVLLFLLWSMGYICNALMHTQFELASCWTGFQTLGGAGILATIKYIVDSKFNSEAGENPYPSILPNNLSFSLKAEANSEK